MRSAVFAYIVLVFLTEYDASWRAGPAYLDQAGWFELPCVCGCRMSKSRYTQVSNNTGDVNMTDIYLIGFCWFAICFVLGAIWVGRP